MAQIIMSILDGFKSLAANRNKVESEEDENQEGIVGEQLSEIKLEISD